MRKGAMEMKSIGTVHVDILMVFEMFYVSNIEVELAKSTICICIFLDVYLRSFR